MKTYNSLPVLCAMSRFPFVLYFVAMHKDGVSLLGQKHTGFSRLVSDLGNEAGFSLLR